MFEGRIYNACGDILSSTLRKHNPGEGEDSHHNNIIE